MKKVIATPNAPKAVGPYSQAIEVNGTLYVSGQIPVVPADGSVPEKIEDQTRQSLKNIGAILEAAGMTYERLLSCWMISQTLLPPMPFTPNSLQETSLHAHVSR